MMIGRAGSLCKVGRGRTVATLAAIALLLAACSAEGAAPVAEAQPDDEATADAQATDQSQEGEAFYAGKTIELVVPYGAGGGTDANARFFSGWYPQFIDGEPTVQVRNVPGGAGIQGMNRFALQSPRDGTAALITTGSGLVLEGLGHPEVEFDTSGWVPVIGAPAGAVVSVRPDTGIEEDRSNAGEIELIAPMLDPGGDTIYLMAYELLGLNFEPVFGYEDSGAKRIAFESGEGNIDWQSTLAYRQYYEPLVEAGDAFPLFSMGQVVNGDIERDPAFPDVPHIGELYEIIHGQPPSGEVWERYKEFNTVIFGAQKVIWLHDDAPQEAIDAWVDASVALVSDTDFQDAVEAQFGPYEMLAGDDLEGIADQISMGDELSEYVSAWLREEYNYVLE